jgi:hypothetical protein
MIADFIATKDKRWEEVIDCCEHDFYHLPAYNEFAAEHEGGRSMAFYAEDNGSKFLIPLIQRELPPAFKEYGEYYDFTTPYGYSSPLLFPKNNALFLNKFLYAFQILAKEKKNITAFIRLNPFLEFPIEILQNFGQIDQHGEIVYVNLSIPMEEIWRSTRKNHRVGIKKLTKEGFETVINDWSYYDDFTKIYIATMQRVNAADYYFFTEKYFRELRKILGNILNLCIVLAPSGEIASGGLFTSMNGFTQCHLTATSKKFFEKAPCKLIFNAIRIWSKDHGNKIINLGGGVGGQEDTLFHYKKGFSKLTKPFHSFAMVFDRDIYADLSKGHKKDFSPCHSCEKHYFPLYRKS